MIRFKKNNFQLQTYRLVVILFIAFFISLTLWPSVNSAPLKANYWLGWSITDSQAVQLAKWDLLILDMETQINSRSQLQKIKKLNPNIKILAYITSQEIRKDALYGNSIMRKKLVSGIYNDWYLTDFDDNRITFWPGTYMLNPADTCPNQGGKRFNEYLAGFVVNEIFSTGLWDGIFYDNAWGSLTWLTGNKVDFNKDGKSDSNIDLHWQNGFKFLFNETRRLSGDNFIVMGNGNSSDYVNELNGIMLENFASDNLSWKQSMQIYNYYENGSQTPKTMVINANTNNTGNKNDYKKMRFGLASALMGGGYSSFDHGSADHAQTWWYDEYDVDLGKPVGKAVSANNYQNWQEDVWRRNYSNGLALVNSTYASSNVDLGGEYEKIGGKQDIKINDGSIVENVSLSGRDGLLMLKSLQAETIDNVAFTNGDFLRFFDMHGNKVRNGLFAYDESLPGGAKIFKGDLDGKGKNEKITVEDWRFQIFNNKGERWYNYFPFGGNYTGEMNLAVGRLFGDKDSEILVAAEKGGYIVMYNYHGYTMQAGFYPFGFADRSGFNLAIGNLDGGKASEVIIGVVRGSTNEVLIYDHRLDKLKNRFAVGWGASQTRVASGDVNGDGVDEVIVGLSVPGKSVVKVFDINGKKLSEFIVPSTFGNNQIDVESVDINFDGRDDVVVMTK